MTSIYGSFTYLLLTIFGPLLLNFSYKFYKARTRLKGLPQPPHDFLFGHLKVVGEIAASLPPNCHPQHYYTIIAQRYGLKDMFYLDLWPAADPQCVLIDPNLQDAVTVNRSANQHDSSRQFIEAILGKGVVAVVNGPVWKKLHNAMAPAFSWSNIRILSGVVQEETMRFRQTLDTLAETGEVFSMEEESAKLIFDVITRVVFNFSLDAQIRGSQTLDDLRELVKLAESQLSFNPLAKLKAWFRKQTVVRRLDPEVMGKIDERLALLKQKKIVPSRKNPLSILDLMLRETVAENLDHDRPLSAEDKELLLNNIKGLLLGGHGTTTDTFCYTLMLLSKDPDAVKRMREEHAEIFGRDLSTIVETLTDHPEKAEELHFTTAVIKETLRLFPVGFGPKEALPGQTVTYDGRVFPVDGGLAVVPLAHALHYDPRYFKEPAEFRPQRFMDADNPVARSYWRTFGRGSRACLGQNFAVNELRVILLLVMHDFDFECAGLTPNEKPKATYTYLDTAFGDIVFSELGLEAKPRGGMMMTVKRRK